jgi:DNA-binding NtrC family response regulator
VLRPIENVVANGRRIGSDVEAAASGGTLFLDEVGDMPLATQAKLLGVLQDRVVRPLGGTASVQLDLRIVAATNKDVPAMVRDGRFREDLYYRLAVIPIRLPSLRDRPEDIMLIAEHFLRETAARLGKAVEGFDDTAVQWMQRHTWPGNVRELENVVERAVVLAHASKITRDDLGTEFTLDAASAPLRPTLATLEGEYVRRVLDDEFGQLSRDSLVGEGIDVSAARAVGCQEDRRRLATAPARVSGAPLSPAALLAMTGRAGDGCRAPEAARPNARQPAGSPYFETCRALRPWARWSARCTPDGPYGG